MQVVFPCINGSFYSCNSDVIEYYRSNCYTNRGNKAVAGNHVHLRKSPSRPYSRMARWLSGDFDRARINRRTADAGCFPLHQRFFLYFYECCSSDVIEYYRSNCYTNRGNKAVAGNHVHLRKSPSRPYSRMARWLSGDFDRAQINRKTADAGCFRLHQRFFLYFYENCNVEVIESLHRKAGSDPGRQHLHCHPEHLLHKSYHCSLRRRVLPA